MTFMPPVHLPHVAAVLSETQNGAMVTAAAGNLVEVRLAANPSTGYSWQVVRGPPAVTVVKQSYAPPATGSGPARLGAAGEQVFDLRVQGLAGRTVPLVLAYKPPGRALAFGRVWKVRLRLVEAAGPASQPGRLR